MAVAYTLQAFRPTDRPIADQYMAFPGNHRRQQAPWGNTPQGQWVDVRTFDASALPWAERLVSFGNYRVVEVTTARKAIPTGFRLGDIVNVKPSRTPFRVVGFDGLTVAIVVRAHGVSAETTVSVADLIHHQGR